MYIEIVHAGVFIYQHVSANSAKATLLFRNEKGEITDIWTDNIKYNVPLELANTAPVAGAGKDFNIFARLFIPVKNVEIISSIYKGKKCVANGKYQPVNSEFFLPLPSSRLAPDKYSVKITLNDGKNKVTQTLPLCITPAL